jgi:hypothetical protein
MTGPYFDKKGVLQLLRNEVERTGSQLAWACERGYDRTVLNSILSGRRDITPRMIQLLKLKTVYVRRTGHGALRVLEEEDVLKLLREEVEKAGGQAEWARRHKHARTHVNRVLARKKPLTGAIATALELKPGYVAQS